VKTAAAMGHQSYGSRLIAEIAEIAQIAISAGPSPLELLEL